MAVQENWFSKADTEEEREKVKQDLGSAANAFNLLSSILKARLKKPSTDYDMANWPCKQADTLGYNRALGEVLKMIE